MDQDALKRTDPQVADLVAAEARRRSETLDLIASENLCPRAVREAVASLLTDKYAEGYPGYRWYGGCEVVDQVEQLAIDRGKALFGCEHINVQPHSGSQANMAVYFAALEPGQTILSMDLAHGGHLTHGEAANFSGRMYHIVHYGVSPETERIDYTRLAEQAREVRPAMIVGGASSYPRAVEVDRLADIAHDVGAHLMIDMAHFAGLVAAGVHPDPVPVADFVTGTTHKTLRGPRGGFVLSKADWARRIDRTVFPGIQGGPLMHVIAGKAVCFGLAKTDAFRRYQERVVANCRAMAEALASRGCRIISGGTDTHLLVVDLRPMGLTGSQAEHLLGAAGIVANRNVIPFDDQPPSDPSGIRIGTPSMTTRGVDADGVRQVAGWIDRVLKAEDRAAEAARVRPEVLAFCQSHPIPD
ncbi:MAG: serine hydroxymethyltransferase [Planctomycetota bacterium]|nr:serine hydroxymethyltransferase [Planctomycetota bacterium]